MLVQARVFVGYEEFEWDVRRAEVVDEVPEEIAVLS